jgi:5S rRNA maturation endonuclease (ribonuclease M5)
MNENNLSQPLVNQITNECCDAIEDLLNDLNVQYNKGYKRIFGPCPIHGGDNPTSWNLYPEGESVRGYWNCYTHHCEDKWKSTLVGFVHAIISEKNKESKWTDAISWMIRFLGYKSELDVKLPSRANLERQRFNNISRRLNGTENSRDNKTWTTEFFRKNFEVPSPYFLSRKYSKEILSRYNIGDSERTNRAVVPVYDEGGINIVGMLGRTKKPKCNDCGFYHWKSEKCPDSIIDKNNSTKWKNSFEASNHLYNMWNARDEIIKSGTAVIVEGPGDVWRLEEAGIKNSVALFGVDITEEQLGILESSWCTNIVLCLDNDEPGKAATKVLQGRLRRMYRIYVPSIKSEDVGSMTKEEIKNCIFPIINEINTFNKTLGVK